MFYYWYLFAAERRKISLLDFLKFKIFLWNFGTVQSPLFGAKEWKFLMKNFNSDFNISQFIFLIFIEVKMTPFFSGGCFYCIYIICNNHFSCIFYFSDKLIFSFSFLRVIINVNFERICFANIIWPMIDEIHPFRYWYTWYTFLKQYSFNNKYMTYKA